MRNAPLKKGLAPKILLGGAAVLLFLTLGCQKNFGAESQFVMGTVCSVNLYESGSPELYGKFFGRLRELNDIFNNYSDSSEITKVNQNAFQAPVPVSKDFYAVLKKALEFASLTDGAFDPTVGPLVKLWGFGKEGQRVPKTEEIKKAKSLVGYQNVLISGPEAPAVSFLKKGVSLDLGAIAKGYAADELVLLCKKEGVKRAVISLGGNVYVYGKKPGGSLWNVAIRDPNIGSSSTAIFSLETKDATVVTSGGYERFFVQDGKTYSHILDTKTGFPAQKGLASVTIVSDSSITADALSTSIFVLGKEKIKELQESPVCKNFECVCVLDDGRAFATSGLKGRLKPLKPGCVVEYF